MANNSLTVADDLTLDADYIAGASIALLGKRGAGKTYACRVLTEALHDAHVQTIVIDPMGVFWGLRASADGEGEGLPIPVFGGEHGDVPLESSAGTLMADLAVDEGLSMVLDLSGFGSRTQERTFVAAFLDRLYRTNNDLVHLIVDEADLFAPQKPRREDAHLLVTMENIVRRGRNRGIGSTMASQRAAVLNKDVLTQVDALVALRVAAPQDRDAIKEWVRGQGDEDTWASLAPSLPSLANGESWWWIPEKHVLQQVQIRPTRTFDSSPTRKRGSGHRAPKTFADVDLNHIAGRIAATIERAKATDPRELSKRISELEHDLDQARKAMPTQTRVEVPVLDEADIERLEKSVHELLETHRADEASRAALMQELERSDAHAAQSVTEIKDAIETLTRALKTRGSSRPDARHPDPSPAATSQAAARQAAPTTPGDQLPPARQRIINALADLQNVGIAPASRVQLALWVGVSPKTSGYANNLGALRTLGLIDYPAPGHISLTDTGRGHAESPSAPFTEAELHQKVQTLLSPARWRILAALIDAHPRALTRDELAEAVGVSAATSGYANNLGALRTLGLIDYPAPGTAAATDVLFIDPSAR